MNTDDVHNLVKAIEPQYYQRVDMFCWDGGLTQADYPEWIVDAIKKEFVKFSCPPVSMWVWDAERYKMDEVRRAITLLRGAGKTVSLW